MIELSLNSKICKMCGACVVICPASIFQRESTKQTPKIVNQEICISCGQCVAICTTSAIVHSDFPDDTIKLINPALNPTPKQALQLIETRRSLRNFKKKPLSKSHIEQIIAAAHAAPTAHNMMSTQYIVLQDETRIKQIVKDTTDFLHTTYKQLSNPFIKAMMMLFAQNEIRGVLHLLPDFKRIYEEFQGGKDTVLYGTPCLIIFHGDSSINYANENANLSVQNASLMAHSLGLASFYPGYVASAAKRSKVLKEHIELPQNHEVFAALAIGHPRFGHTKSIKRKSPQVEWK